MQISAITTFTDWAMHHGTSGLVGIERMFDFFKVAQIQNVYWRAFDGGLATYPSKLASIYVGSRLSRDFTSVGDAGGPTSRHFCRALDFRKFDALAKAVEIGHRRGIAVHAWFTLCEEDHGGPFSSKMGKETRFRKHDRNGKDYTGTIDFFYPEVQKYKLALLDELLERGVDGVLLDFVRSNATPNGDLNGIHRFGYNPEIRAAFRRQYGDDPINLRPDDGRWLRFKQDYISQFIRRIRKAMGEKRPLSIMTIPHVDNRRWLCLDLPTLTGDGTVNHVMPFSMTYDYAPRRVAHDFKALQAQVKRPATAAAGIQAYHGIDPEDFDLAVAAAVKAGASRLTLYEGESLVHQDLLWSVRAWHLNAPRVARHVAVRLVSGAPGESHWKKAHWHQDFILLQSALVGGSDRERPAVRTRFAVLRSAHALHFRIIAEGRQGEVNQQVSGAKNPYIQWLGVRMYWQMLDRAHVMLDPGPSRRGFTHFRIDRSGQTMQGRRNDGAWKRKWHGEVQQNSNNRWTATFEIPFAALGMKPKKGDRIGFQIVREQSATREASAWFVASGRVIASRHWGDMIMA